ncbi:hypothetical protein Shyhy01_21200 [Streptomyces hygroscopicus subsp. hygroscopicus]|nr:hypothetical protein Shyhy01_21200 [Streptomyces hygroscopicus subsp. hygroscopicus]
MRRNIADPDDLITAARRGPRHLQYRHDVLDGCFADTGLPTPSRPHHPLEVSNRLGTVPKALVWDNEGAISSCRCSRPRDFAALTGLLGIQIVQYRPGTRERKS